MSIVSTKGVKLSDDELAAYAPEVSDEEMATRYAEMLGEIYLHVDVLNETACPPDRRLYVHGKEAWIYEHGNVVDLLFVSRD